MIHVIWKGWGYLVIVFVVINALLAQFLTDSISGSKAYWAVHKWPITAALFVSALECWLVGNKLYNRKARVLVDLETSKRVTFRQEHSFFFIPMKWWGPLLVVFALWAWVKSLMS
jgi:hypothetical protein